MDNLKMEKSEITARINLIISKYFDGSSRKFSTASGFDIASVSSFRSGNRTVGNTDSSRGKFRRAGINPDFIYFGSGSELIAAAEDTPEEAFLSAGGAVTDRFFRIYDLPANAAIGVNHTFTDLPVTYSPTMFPVSLNPKKTIVFRASGHSMEDMDIFTGDYLFVDTEMQPIDGKPVVAELNGYLIVKKFRRLKTERGFGLFSEFHGEREYEIGPEDELRIIGVVRMMMRMFY